MTRDYFRLQLLLATFAGWVKRQQALVIDYLEGESRREGRITEGMGLACLYPDRLAIISDRTRDWTTYSSIECEAKVTEKLKSMNDSVDSSSSTRA